MNKKIVMSLSVIAAVSAVVIGGTGAFFSDSETSTGNTFTAGAIDLKVDSQQHYNNAVCVNNLWQLEPGVSATVPQYPVIGTACSGTWGQNTPGVDITNEKFFNFGDIKPGDSGENTISLHVINNDAWVCAAISNLVDADNSTTEPEDAPDLDNLVSGEMQENLIVTIWRDNGDGGGTMGNNVQDGTEPTIYTGAPQAGTWALYDSTTATGPLTGATTGYVGVKWTLPLLVGNEVQTDSMTGDISFTVVQSRNNADFKCSDVQPVIVNANGLETTNAATAKANGKWFFYNDVNDSVMPLNQFVGGVNDIVAGPGSEGAAQMTLHDALARYNIATYKYNDVKLSDIGSLKYRIYDASASAETPYLHFNVDFLNNDTWQRRLVQVPTGVVASTWTTVDALAGMWTYSGPTWPAGAVDGTGTTPGTTPRTWADVKANYPNAETRSTDSFFGVRVGHPGPNGETGYVDWIDFDGEVTDFEN